MDKEQAQKELDKAQKDADDAAATLLEKRQALDEILQEEEAERRAVYLGFEEGDEDGIRAAKALANRRREEKATLATLDFEDSSQDGPIGGVS